MWHKFGQGLLLWDNNKTTLQRQQGSLSLKTNTVAGTVAFSHANRSAIFNTINQDTHRTVAEEQRGVPNLMSNIHVGVFWTKV